MKEAHAEPFLEPCYGLADRCFLDALSQYVATYDRDYVC